jgi:hypothetical protein
MKDYPNKYTLKSENKQIMGKPLDPDFKYEMVFTYQCLGVKQKDIGKMTGRDQGSVSRLVNFTPSRPHSTSKEWQREWKTNWRKNNPEKVKEIAKRSNHKRYQDPKHRAALRDADKRRKYQIRNEQPCEQVKAIYLLAYNLTQATGIQYAVDHIQPLCAGGEHAAYNLQVIPQDQNATKSGKWGVTEQQYFCNGLFD